MCKWLLKRLCVKVSVCYSVCMSKCLCVGFKILLFWGFGGEIRFWSRFAVIFLVLSAFHFPCTFPFDKVSKLSFFSALAPESGLEQVSGDFSCFYLAPSICFLNISFGKVSSVYFSILAPKSGFGGGLGWFFLFLDVFSAFHFPFNFPLWKKIKIVLFFGFGAGIRIGAGLGWFFLFLAHFIFLLHFPLKKLQNRTFFRLWRRNPVLEQVSDDFSCF